VVNDASVVELFQELRTDVQKLSLATYLAQAAEVISQEDCPNRELFSLVLNCLFALSRLGIPEDKIKAVFELRSACIAGFQPDLQGCSVCGTDNAELFDISGGCLVCAGCKSMVDSGIRLPVSPSVLDAMRYICFCEPKQIFRFSVGEDSMESLCHITEAYLITQLERGFSALDFYKSLRLEAT
jgi:DNA repair protein RecO (recombination protein O)